MSDRHPAALRNRDVVLLATADWEHPFWTNKQHVAQSLADLGQRVFYVESVGLRSPRLEAQDLSRVWRRLYRGLKPPRRVAERVWVWSPLLIPAPSRSWQRQLNRLMFSLMLDLWRRWLGFRPDLLWTYNPLTSLLLPLEQCAYRQIVYHCVDDLVAQPCMPAGLIAAEEEKLCRRSSQVFVTSKELLRTRGPYNIHTRYDPNVADIAHFARARNHALSVPQELIALPSGPRLGFIGAISRYKVDLELIAKLACHHSDCQVVLIGRVGEGDPDTDLTCLKDLSNVHILGPRSYDQLPHYLAGFDVALLPCPINAYTRSMFPMKFFEYLAAGVPVVTTDLPALVDYQHLATFCASHQDFLQAIDRLLLELRLHGRAALATPLDELPACCSYRERTRAMLAQLEALQG